MAKVDVSVLRSSATGIALEAAFTAAGVPESLRPEGREAFWRTYIGIDFSPEEVREVTAETKPVKRVPRRLGHAHAHPGG